MPNHRDVREEQDFQERIDELRGKYPRIDEVWELISWTLSRNPERGDKLPDDPQFRVYQTNRIGYMPSFFVLYSFDAELVCLHSITVEASDDDEDENVL